MLWLEQISVGLKLGINTNVMPGINTNDCQVHAALGKKCLVKMTKCMVTAVSRFIEQVGSMIKEIPKHNYQQSNPSNFKELAGQPNQFIGNYPVQNQIIA